MTAAANVQLLTDLLEGDPALREAVAVAVADLFSGRDQTAFLTEAGILPSTGFFSELWRRASLRLLPMPPDLRRLDDALATIFHCRRDYAWLYDIPAGTRDAFWRSLQGAAPLNPEKKRDWALSLVSAVRVLSVRAAAMGIDPELRRIAGADAQSDAAFYALATEGQAAAAAFTSRLLSAGEEEPEVHRRLLAALSQCRHYLRVAHATASREGTSLRLTFLMVRLDQTTRRLALIVRLLAGGGGAARDADLNLRKAWVALFRDGVRGVIRRDSVFEHFHELVGLLALRITDNAAQTGEHYVTSTRAEYWRMWRAAAGAGAIIGVMALLKILASKFELAPMNQAFIYSLNYALGFMLVHVLHFTIATKQPAMTAATLAASISEVRGHLRNLARVGDLVAQTARSQLAAILGNVMVAFPVALALGAGLSWFAGGQIIAPEKSEHLLQELDPLRSLALFHAAIAGVYLFLSGLIAGNVDNLCSYRRIPERVAALAWLRRLAGATRAERFGAYVRQNLGGLAGNFFFGIFLGTTGTIGYLFGLPLDIRHVAFSAANLGYALIGLDFDIPLRTLLRAIAGVGLIGAVNLGVSFSLALWVALRSRGVEFAHTRQLLVLLARRFIRSPRDFLILPRSAGK